MNTKDILYVLSCGHVMPSSRYNWMDDTYCFTCNAQYKPVDVHVFEWKLLCETCGYSRWTGLSRDLAAGLINGHCRKYPWHKGKILYVQHEEAKEVLDKIRES